MAKKGVLFAYWIRQNSFPIFLGFHDDDFNNDIKKPNKHLRFRIITLLFS